MILAIDLGSTSFKTALLDRKLRVRGFCARRVQHRLAAGGRVELDVAEASTALRRAIREAIATAGLRAAAVQVVAITSQAQTFTLIDSRGRHRLPFISWQDNRAVAACEQLKAVPAMGDFGRHCSFGTLLPALQLCQLKHLRNTRPELLDPNTRVVNLPTFFLHRWTGVAAVDQNLAAMSGLYSLALQGWWPPALRLCGLHPNQLPDLCPIGTAVARTQQGAVVFGLPQNIPVVLAGNDQTAGAFAAQLGESHGLLVTLGTAQVAYLHTDRMPRPDPDLVRGPYPHAGHYRMAADSYGGNLINWAETVLARCSTDDRFCREAARAQPACQGLTFEPTNDRAGGSWSNIGLHHTPADFARSVLECLTRRMAGMIRRLGVRLDQTPVLAAGGGSENSLWVRLLADTLGTNVRVTQGRPFLGAARMALQPHAHSPKP